ncbi:rhodanese-like domain-containing protein [Amorphus sp. 3PC139-8]|uniref:rhodanese-like domain-containing protein n=1 Tax=Amorphus sp. 3PC139-8 TaxID=2735676 RepID=UPI00345DF9E3
MTSDEAYAGDLPSTEAWNALKENTSAVLIDVRTQAEWTFVGIPDLSGVGKMPALVEWQRYPTMDTNPEFVDLVGKALAERGATADTPIYFLCRSGGRSRQAAIVMTAAGFKACFNVSDGFEGPIDTARHRGGVAGWKASGLPWIQS